ncbi:elongation factor P 5-aminopentanone reductase [Lapidilactobacillus bayanensis]|uniref:elongation factor P 5-aminopentanone reductase n=1 Tax=Lapidilactobacillus bayanensis TaxID=2485998 RepID=UPI000F7BA764|nr:SDR family oxidoreductase [Lapidilactobacillus bayanensis]
MTEFKRALVFGASGNIGQAICQSLAESGWSLMMQYHRHQAVVEQCIVELQQEFPQQEFQSLPLDFCQTNLDYQAILTGCGDYQALIFAQGTTDYQLFVETSDAQIQTLFQQQLFTPMGLIKAAQERLQQHQHGRIIFIGSIYGGVGSAMEVAYSSVKGAQSSFANAYAREVAANGLTVNVVAPGAVNTQMNADFSEDQLADLAAEIPVGRMARPQEIAVWVNNLLAPEADYLTGQTIYVDGGWLK